jgi:ketol-acid reductoisomerase
MRKKEAGLQVEAVGATLRAAMPFLDPVVVKDGVPQPAAAATETVNA